MKRLVACAIVLSACSSNSTDMPRADSSTMPDASSGDSSGLPSDGGGSDDDGRAASCSAARATLLGSIDAVATTDVNVLGTSSGVMTLYVDASAGGPSGASTNPWIFVDLSSGAKVPVTDTTSMTSTAWDLAFKRPLIYTNDGDGGPGNGGSAFISKKFDAVTGADASGTTIATETFFDADCTPNLDPTGAVLTTFATWSSYDVTTHILTPIAGAWLVRGGTGKLYKIQIETYYGTPDGGTGTAGGKYLLKVGAL